MIITWCIAAATFTGSEKMTKWSRSTVATAVALSILHLGHLTWLMPYSKDLIDSVPVLAGLLDLRILVVGTFLGIMSIDAFVRNLFASTFRYDYLRFGGPLLPSRSVSKRIRYVLWVVAQFWNGITRLGVILFNLFWVPLQIALRLIWGTGVNLWRRLTEIWVNGAIRQSVRFTASFVCGLLMFTTVVKGSPFFLDYLRYSSTALAIIILIGIFGCAVASTLLLFFVDRLGRDHVGHAEAAFTAIGLMFLVSGWIVYLASIRVSNWDIHGLQFPKLGPLLWIGTISFLVISAILYLVRRKRPRRRTPVPGPGGDTIGSFGNRQVNRWIVLAVSIGLCAVLLLFWHLAYREARVASPERLGAPPRQPTQTMTPTISITPFLSPTPVRTPTLTATPRPTPKSTATPIHTPAPSATPRSRPSPTPTPQSAYDYDPSLLPTAPSTPENFKNIGSYYSRFKNRTWSVVYIEVLQEDGWQSYSIPARTKTTSTYILLPTSSQVFKVRLVSRNATSDAWTVEGVFFNHQPSTTTGEADDAPLYVCEVNKNGEIELYSTDDSR